MTVDEQLSTVDRLAIVELYGRYSQAFDGGQAHVCTDLFTADGVFSNKGRTEIVGGAALLEFFSAAAARSAGTRHVVSNIVLETLSPDRARGSAYVVVLRIDSAGLTLVTMGDYTDEFARVDGRWRIAKRLYAPAIPDGLAGVVLARVPG